MSITYDLIRGHTDTIILASLMDGDSYGYKINKDILTRTDNQYELKEATLYTAFKRLEENGCIPRGARRLFCAPPESFAAYSRIACMVAFAVFYYLIKFNYCCSHCIVTSSFSYLLGYLS